MESTQEQDTSAGFRYSDLPDAGTYIRLIRVTKAEDCKTIHCELSIWSKDSAPPYNAISYTWGDPVSTGVIMLNDKRITVRMNCEYVLRQAYWHNREGYIWVDALCINQDNVAEKNVQVAMMGDIFKSARRVLACVGPLADDSKYLLCIIRDNSQCYTFIADIYDTLIADVTDPDYRWKYIEEYNLRTGLTPRNMDSHICRWLLQWFPLGFARVARAHNHFFRRPYFNRIWILQELFLAKDIVICCGNDQLPFRLLPGHLVMMLWLVKLRRTSVRISWKYLKLTKPRRMILMRLISRGIGVRDDDDPIGDSLPIDVGRKGSDRLLTVHEYLTRFQGECQDPRDMIYATLSMIDWCGNTQMHPDYGKSCFQLALEVLAHVDSNADLFNETLSEWLVKNLQLHREREVEIRVSEDPRCRFSGRILQLQDRRRR